MARAAAASRVYLNVYDLASTSINESLIDVGLGLFHSGIEVHGVEWTFAGGGGICSSSPRHAPGHVFRSSTCIGETRLGARDVDALIARLRPDWPGTRYHTLRCKCVLPRETEELPHSSSFCGPSFNQTAFTPPLPPSLTSSRLHSLPPAFT